MAADKLSTKIDGIIRRWLPNQSYGYNEAVAEIMDALSAHPEPASSPGLRERVEALADEWEGVRSSSDSYVAASHDHASALRALLSSAPEEPEADAAVVDNVALAISHWMATGDTVSSTGRTEIAQAVVAIVKGGKA